MAQRTCGTVSAGVYFFPPPCFPRQEPRGNERERLIMVPALPGADLVSRWEINPVTYSCAGWRCSASIKLATNGSINLSQRAKASSNTAGSSTAPRPATRRAGRAAAAPAHGGGSEPTPAGRLSALRA